MNLQQPESPTLADPAGDQTTSGPKAEITAVAWNTAVPHILATADAGGTAVVWNLKEERPWAQLRDPQRNPISSVAWHPTQGVYLITATDDDARPVLKVWDLRSNTSSPLTEFRGHTRGVLSVAWCPHDSNLIVTTGKDNRTLLWDINLAAPIAELPGSASAAEAAGAVGGSPFGNAGSAFGGAPAVSPFGSAAPMGAGAVFGGASGADTSASSTTAGRRFTAQWSPCVPGLMASASFDRNVQIINGQAIPAAAARKAAEAPGSASASAIAQAKAAGQMSPPPAGLVRAPQWARRTAGVAFGFGGKIAVFGDGAVTLKKLGETDPTTRQPRAAPAKTVKVFNTASAAAGDATFVASAAQLHRVLSAQDPAELVAFAAERAAGAAGAAGGAEGKSQVWKFIGALLDTNTTRASVLKHLGLDASEVAAAASKYAKDVQLGSAMTEQQQEQQQQLAQEAALQQPAGIQPPAAQAPPPAPAAQPSPFAQGGGADAAGIFGGAGPAANAASVFGSSSAGAADLFSTATPAEPSSPDAASDKASNDGWDLSAPSSPAPEVESVPTAAPIAPAVSETAGPTAADLGVVPESNVGQAAVPAAKSDSLGATLVRQALLVGDFEAAVKVLLQQNRFAEALILAAGSADNNLWKSAKDLVWDRLESPFTALTRDVLTYDLGKMVANAELRGGAWKRLLAALHQYARAEDFRSLCEALGDRLSTEGGDEEAVYATLCYMCALNAERVVPLWVSAAERAWSAPTSAGAESRLQQLQALVERILVFRSLVQHTNAAAGVPGAAGGAQSPAEARILGRYATLLAEQGQVTLASAFAGFISQGAAAGDVFSPEPVSAAGRAAPAPSSSALDVAQSLAFRLFYALPVETTQSRQQPNVPFTFRAVNPSPEVTGIAAAPAPAPAPAPQHAPSAAPAQAHGANTGYQFGGAQQSFGGGYPQQAAAPAPAPVPAPAPAPAAQQGYGNGYGNGMQGGASSGYHAAGQQGGAYPASAAGAYGAPAAPATYDSSVPIQAPTHGQGYGTGQPQPQNPGYHTQVAAPMTMPAHAGGFQGGQLQQPAATGSWGSSQRDPSRPLPAADGFPSSAGNPALGAKYNNHVSTTTMQAPIPQQQFPTQPGTFPSAADAAAAVVPAAAPAPEPEPQSFELTPQAQEVLSCLTNIMSQLESQGLTGAEPRKVEEGKKAVAALEALYRSGRVAGSVEATLQEMAAAARAYNMTATLKAHQKISAVAWDVHKGWLKGIKHSLLLGQKKWRQ